MLFISKKTSVSLALALALVGCGGGGGDGDGGDTIGAPFAKLTSKAQQVTCTNMNSDENGAAFAYSERDVDDLTLSEDRRVGTFAQTTTYHEGHNCDLDRQADIRLTYPSDEGTYKGTAISKVLRTNGSEQNLEVSRVSIRASFAGELQATGAGVLSAEPASNLLRLRLQIGNGVVRQTIEVDPASTFDLGYFLNGDELGGSLEWDAEEGRFIEN